MNPEEPKHEQPVQGGVVGAGGVYPPQPVSPTQTPPPVATPQQVVGGYPPQPEKHHGSRRLLLIVGVVACVLLALVIALLLVLITNKNGQTNSGNNSTNSGTQSTIGGGQQQAYGPYETSNGDMVVYITGLVKSGDTLAVNYRVESKDKNASGMLNMYDKRAGIYTLSSADRDVPEPYFIDDSTGKKYGLVKDDSGKALVSTGFNSYAQHSETRSGYVTLTLPTNGTKGSLSLGSMPVIPNITVKY